MKAVIMCGGVGSRLRPLTESTPKPLIKLLNVPVLKQIIDRLINYGITDIGLSLGYMAADIISFCESTGFNAKLSYHTEEKPLGTAGGVKNCINSTNDTVLVLSGDNIFGFDLHEIERYHQASGADFTVIGKKCADPREYGTILTDKDGNITGFCEKPTWESAQSFLINTGTYIFNGKILEMIPENTVYDFSDDLFPRMLKTEKKFKCYTTEKLWGDIGEFESYLSLTSFLLANAAKDTEYRGRLYTEDFTDENGNYFIAPCLVDRAFTAGKNNKIGPFTVIGSEVTIGSDCTLGGSVIGNNCNVADCTDITGAILDDCVKTGDNCCIEKGSVLGYGVTAGRFSRTLGGVKIWPGRTVQPESVVGGDIFFETPQRVDFDIFGISGKVCSQLSVTDAAKIGQALASVNEIQRIGIGSDGNAASEIYRDVIISGARSCGAICYDFGEIFKAQSYFYSAYCSLDAFIYVSLSGDVINFSFFGKDGLPFSEKMSRRINNNFRFSSFSFADVNDIPEKFRMNLLSTVYGAALNKAFTKGENGISLTCESENEIVKKTFDTFARKNSSLSAKTKIQMLINESGSDMYCIENEKFYSSDRIRAAVAETVFAEGKDIIVKEDAPDCIFRKAKEYGRVITEVFENSYEEAAAAGISLVDNLWCFDALFLGAKLAGILSVTGLSLEELCSLQDDFTLRRTIIDADCPPSEIKNRILGLGAKKTKRNNVYYSVSDKKGTVKLRQMGNSGKIRVLVEAADMETAKELGASIERKFELADIDNSHK